MARKPAADSKRAAFATLLAGHLGGGTRPATAMGEPWTYAAFAEEIPGARDNQYASASSVSNWCKGTSLPAGIVDILRALFGPETSNRHTEAREELRRAFQAARAEVVAGVKPDPAGPRWVVSGEQIVIDRSVRPSDRDAADDPVRQQLQTAIAALAGDLVEPTARLTYTRAWAKLSETAAAFRDTVAGDPHDMPAQFGTAYALLLRLGGFLETDIRIQRDTAASDSPLDADIHGMLTALVRIAAPWLRGFPTVEAWDDAAGKAVGRSELFQPAREFVRKALLHGAIPAADAAEMTALQDAAGEDGFQHRKAGARGVGGTMNLILTAALSLSGEAGIQLMRWVLATFADAEAEVAAFVATLQPDQRQALLGMVQEVRNQPALVVVAKPDWASARGTDAFGEWADIALPGKNGRDVVQRLRLIQPGTFQMGSPNYEHGRSSNEGPVHAVTIGEAFWLFDTPCTQALWEAVMGTTPNSLKGPMRPVENVSFFDVGAFTDKLNVRIDGLNLRLPSEAQWEYACRAGTMTPTYASPGQSLDDIAWYSGNSGGQTHDVAGKKPNAWGLYDMLGNVWDWCRDGWVGNYKRPPTDGSHRAEPGRAFRVIRGGNSSFVAQGVRSAVRSGARPAHRDFDLGFRLSRGRNSVAGPELSILA